ILSKSLSLTRCATCCPMSRYTLPSGSKASTKSFVSSGMSAGNSAFNDILAYSFIDALCQVLRLSAAPGFSTKSEKDKREERTRATFWPRFDSSTIYLEWLPKVPLSRPLRLGFQKSHFLRQNRLAHFLLKPRIRLATSTPRSSGQFQASEPSIEC